MLKQCAIRFVTVVLALFLLQLFFIGYHPIRVNFQYILTDDVDIGFSVSEYEQAKFEETKLQNEYDLTAILLHWKRLEGVKKTVQYLANTNLFRQIIIWNNNPQIHLTVQHFTTNDQMQKYIHIINSKVNLKDEAKYRACAQAKTRACFYVDDDWNVSQYLKSLISSYRSDPNLLHSVTDAYTFYTNLVWTYIDSTIDLHTGFSWIGCGSIFLRQHAEQYLQLMNKFLRNHTNLIGFSDVFFSVWLNEVPVQINTNIRYQPSKTTGQHVAFSSTSNFYNLQHTGSVLAIRILENSLRFDRPNKNEISFSRQQNRRFPVYVKSTSSNDDLIFYSNILPFHYQNIPFRISRDYERGTRKNLPRHPSVRYFLHHTTWKSVDGDLSTCWHSHRELRANDFYAIDFLFIQNNVTFTIAVAHSARLQINLDVRVSFDGLRWLSYQSKNGIYRKQNRTLEEHLHTYLFNSNEFSPGFRSFRYISFKAIEEWDYHFQVCEIEIISKKAMAGVMKDFDRLEI